MKIPTLAFLFLDCSVRAKGPRAYSGELFPSSLTCTIYERSRRMLCRSSTVCLSPFNDFAMNRREFRVQAR
jgi:hypothetical protein